MAPLVEANFLKIIGLKKFIDKTLLIKYLFDTGYKFWIFTAPPGFGKSTNLDMVKRFLEIEVDRNTGNILSTDNSTNYKIFKNNNLLISKEKAIYERHFAQYPTIHLSFRNVSGEESLEKLLESFVLKLSKSFEPHQYLMQSEQLTETDKDQLSQYIDIEKCKKLNQSQLESGIEFLAKMLVKHYHGKKVFIAVDDFDYPIMSRIMYDENSILKDVFNFCQNIFATLTKPDGPFGNGLFVGTTMFSSVCFTNRSTLKRYCFFLSPMENNKFFGVTCHETIELLKRYHIYSQPVLEELIDFYCYRRKHPTVATASLMQFVETRKFLDYRDEKFMLSTMEIVLDNSKIRYLVEELLLDENGLYVSDNDRFERNLEFDNVNPLINDDGSGYIKKSLFLLFLLNHGYLEFPYEESADKIGILNDFNYAFLHNSITRFYGSHLNEELDDVATVINKITPFKDKWYRKFLLDLIAAIKMYYEEFKDGALTNNAVEFTPDCISDIFAKSAFRFPVPTFKGNGLDESQGVYTRYSEEHKTVIILVLQLNTGIETLLRRGIAERVKMDLSHFEEIAETVIIALSVTSDMIFTLGYMTENVTGDIDIEGRFKSVNSKQLPAKIRNELPSDMLVLLVGFDQVPRSFY